MSHTVLHVSDDSGFLAIVDPDGYRGFIDENWSLEQMGATMREQMAARTLLIWGTGREGLWNVEVRRELGDVDGFRQATGTIASLRGRLLLTNYESLTMAAQYADVSLPQRHEMDCLVTVVPGIYLCRVTQLRNPEESAVVDGETGFVVELVATKRSEPAWTDVPWRGR